MATVRFDTCGCPMSGFLLEIGTEELPASFIVDAQRNLCDGFADLLKSNSIAFSSVRGLSTPRRLAVLVTDISLTQSTTTRRVKGPPVASSFEDNGSPKPAAKGFAAKHNMTVDQLEHETIADVAYLVAQVVSTGKPVAYVLQTELPKLISRLSGERMMRWASSDFKFSRPIRWVVALLDKEVVSFVVNDVRAGRQSYGHRILHPEPISINEPDTYAEQLLAAFVQVDPLLRRKKIEDEVTVVATALHGRPRRLSGALLDEVVNITEWPTAVSGDFAKEYLDLPDALIETVMVHHQKYFPVEELSASETRQDLDSSNRLLPHFITISNNDRTEARPYIKQGNERVLKARLADGRFFYFDDQKTKLSDRKEVVSQLTFQEGLGSYGDKVTRTMRVAEAMKGRWQLAAEISIPLERTLELCKSDLVTNLVRELPELQGHVGSWYAKQEGQPIEVVRAIASHYAPRFTEDDIPPDLVGQLASVIDKADTLVGLFLLGKKPTGSSDPYALRRQAQGLVDVLIDGVHNTPVDVTELLEQVLIQFDSLKMKMKSPVPADKVLEDLNEFLLQRIKNKMANLSSRREVIDAAVGAGALHFLSVIKPRISAIEDLLKTENGINLTRAGVRIGNILKGSLSEELEPSLFSDDAEKALWEAYCNAFPHIDKAKTASSFGAEGDALKALARNNLTDIVDRLQPLVDPINQFFVDVMVNDVDLKKRANRHALLHHVYSHFALLADFTKLQSVIA